MSALLSAAYLTESTVQAQVLVTAEHNKKAVNLLECTCGAARTYTWTPAPAQFILTLKDFKMCKIHSISKIMWGLGIYLSGRTFVQNV